MEAFWEIIQHSYSDDDMRSAQKRQTDEFVRVGVATAVAFTVLPALDWKTQREAI